MSEKYCVFVTQGGMGKQIASTAVAEAIKKNHPDRKLIVVSSYPEVYINNPNVDRVFRLGMSPYFYKDYIYEKDTIVFNGEPYFTAEHIHKRRHLILNWCDLFKIEYNGERPQLFFNQLEKDNAFRKWLMPLNGRPVCILQTNGGPLNGDKPYCWTRDMPPGQTQEIVDRLKKDYHIYHITRPNCFKLNDVQYLPEIGKRELLSLLTISTKRILIDSSMQHAAAALELPSTVLWIGTSSKSFGYKIHKNLTPVVEKNMDHLTDAFLFDYDFNGHEVEYPYSTNQLFDINEVVK